MNAYFIQRNTCPACGSTNSRELLRIAYCDEPMFGYLHSFYDPQGGAEFEYLRDQDYVLVECPHCSLMYQSEIPNDFLMRRLYEQWIGSANALSRYEASRTADFYSRLAAEVSTVLQLFNTRPAGLRFLDYSMGWGHWCRMAMAFGCNVQGTEYGLDRRRHAATVGIDAIDEEDIGRHTYHFIRASNVLEHIQDPKSTLLRLVSGMEPTGLLSIDVPSAPDILQRIQRADWKSDKMSQHSLNAVAPLEHINTFNRKSLLILAESAGLEPVRVPQIPWYPQSLRSTLSTLLGLLLERVMGGAYRHYAERNSTSIVFRRSDVCHK